MYFIILVVEIAIALCLVVLLFEVSCGHEFRELLKAIKVYCEKHKKEGDSNEKNKLFTIKRK